MRQFLRTPTLVGLALLIWVSADASSRTRNQSARDPENPTGVIVGKVVDGVSGQPVTEVVVFLAGTRDQLRVMVDGEGRFFFPGLPSGQYRITAEKFGYQRGAVGRTHPAGTSLPVVIADGQRVTDAIVPMWKLGSISGRVVDESGEPVVGITVRMLPQVAGPVVTTDDRGVYRLPMMPPGDYIVVVPARVTTIPVELMRGGASSADLFGAISEVAPLGDRRNLQIGDHVLATTASAPIPPAPQRDGRLTVYQTTFYPTATSRGEAQAIALGPGDERVGIDIQLKPVPSFTVSGQMTGPDGPLARTSLRLLRSGGPGMAEESGFEAVTGLTDNKGRFTLLGVPRGQYRLRVLTPSIGGPGRRPDEAPTVWANETVTVNETDVKDLLIAARRAPIFSGRIQMIGDRALPPSGFELIVQAIDPGPFRVVNPRLDREQRFATQLAPGRYMVAAYAPPETWCTSVAVAGRVASDEPIEVRDENVAIVITCGGEPTRLTGMIRDGRGEIDPRANAVAFPVDRRYWSGATIRPLRLASARAAASGAFALVNLPPGEYFVAAISDAASASWKDPKVLDALARSGTRVALSSGQTQTIQLQTVAIR
jgi:hypothetical protein